MSVGKSLEDESLRVFAGILSSFCWGEAGGVRAYGGGEGEGVRILRLSAHSLLAWAYALACSCVDKYPVAIVIAQKISTCNECSIMMCCLCTVIVFENVQ